MARYLDLSYREDTYGERIRTEVPIRITDYGYTWDQDDVAKSNVVVQVGPISGDYPDGSRVSILRSFTYHSPNPDRLIYEKKYNQSNDTTDFLYSVDQPLLVPDEDSYSYSGRTFQFRSGMDPLGEVPLGSVLYIDVYVSEPFFDTGVGRTIWLPWDHRGSASKVIPNDYGGSRSGMDALPRGVMTGGLVYGEHIWNSQTIFMAAMGYVIDMITTDGQLMVNTPESLHPNILLPMLRGLGMTKDEEAFFSDNRVHHRLKHILTHYRQVMLSKGTPIGLSKYFEVATGLENMVVGPLNMLLDRSDTCPDNVDGMGVPGNFNDFYSVSTTASAWRAVPSLGHDTGYKGSDPVHRRPVMPKLPNNEDDPWFDPKNPYLANEAVHRFEFTGAMRFGSKQLLNEYSTHYCAMAQGNRMYQIRYRYWADVRPIEASAALVFLDADGKVLERHEYDYVQSNTNEWVSFIGSLVSSPHGTAYLAWDVLFKGNGPVSVGAIQVGADQAMYKYRDPRSMGLIVDTGAPPIRASWVTMDSVQVQMDDGNVIMDDGRVYDDPTVDSYERVLLAKTLATLPKYLPAGVPVHMITADDIEFQQFWAPDSI